MKSQMLIALAIVTTNSFGQCGEEHPNGLYHNSRFVSPMGDTLNRLDSSGFYEGLHVYTDNPGNNFRKSRSFIIGKFHHGIPVGEWKDYCADGTYSIGEFSCGGGESISDGNGGRVTKKQGIYVK